MYVYEASPFSPNSRATTPHGYWEHGRRRVRSAHLVPPRWAAAEDGDPHRRDRLAVVTSVVTTASRIGTQLAYGSDSRSSR